MSEPVASQDNARSLHDEGKRYVRAHNVIKGFALEVAQLLFYEGNPTGFCWDPSQEKTQIMVVDKYSFNLDQVGTTPAVVANRGPLRWMGTSGFRQMQSINLQTDARTHTDLIQGSATLSCFSRHGMEAEDIAGYLHESFHVFRDVLRKIARRGIMAPTHLGFFKIEATSMGEEALVKADSRPEISVVPVAIQAMVQRRWSVTPQARKLQDIVVRTSRSGTP
jgi:hypothetical protein